MEASKISKIIRMAGDSFEFSHLIRGQSDLTTILQKLGYTLADHTNDGFYDFYIDGKGTETGKSLLFFFDNIGALLKLNINNTNWETDKN